MTTERQWDGLTIREPGLIAGLPITDYHRQVTAGPSVSSSGLRSIWAESPAHFYARWSGNPDRVPEDDNPAFNVGRLAHKLLLEGREGLERDFAIRPDIWSDFRSKDARVWRDEQILAGKTVVTEDDLTVVSGMARSLAAHPLVKAGVLNGRVERSLIWRDAETGIWLKSRPDVIPNASAVVADLKTTTSVTTASLEKSLAAFSYHVQAAIVAMGLREILDMEMEEFALVWVEKKPPYCVRVTTLTGADIERGRLQARAALRMMARCLEKGDWPGPGGDHSDAHYLALPQWEATRIDRELELLGAMAQANDNADHGGERAA